MNKFQGSINKIIFKSDNNYMVLLFKVLKNDLDNKYNNKTITITGYFYDISEELNLEIRDRKNKPHANSSIHYSATRFILE